MKVHKFINNQKKLVLDIASGTILEVDDLVYELLGEDDIILPKEPTEAVEEALKEIEILKTSGLLYSDELEVEPIAAGGVKALCLHVAHDCNLRCSYCFASQGDFRGERALMDFETAKRAIDFVVEESGNRHNIEIDFFGGEPLMNLELVKQTVDYARSLEKEKDKHFRFTLTTNGLLLDKKIREYLNQTMDNVVLSLDGRKETNDRHRKTVTGEGSYDYILENIREMAKLRGEKDHYVRGTFTADNLDFSEDVIDLYEKGFRSISVEPVVAEKGSPQEIKTEQLEQIKEEYEKIARFKLENDFEFFHFNIDLEGGPCLYKRVSGCGAGVDYLAITPNGDIYPCHQFVGEEKFKLGNLYTGITNDQVVEHFKRANVFEKEACQNCWCKYYCSGGCHANVYHHNGNLEGNYEVGCEMQKKRVETAMMLLTSH